MKTSIKVESFGPEHRLEWDEFVDGSRNGTFLLNRDYVEYHADKILDESLLFLDPKDRLIAVLPANRNASELVSHGGLTYGGFIIGDSVRQATMEEMVHSLIDYARRHNVNQLVYCPVPWIYHRSPVESDVVAVTNAGAVAVRRQILSVIPINPPIPMTTLRRRSIRLAERSGVEIRKSEDWHGFWDVLTTRLAQKHESRPLHKLEEIERLARLFPKSIHLHTACLGSEQVAGAVVYESDQVARVQYMATTEVGRRIGALDLLISRLLREEYTSKSYIDLGSSQIPGTDEINQGLLNYKEGFGARTIIQTTFRADLDA